MFLIFHLAIPLLIFEFPYMKTKIKINRLILAIASLLPDIIDKPLLLLGLGSGRGISHSLLFVIFGTLTVLFFSSILFKDNEKYTVTLSFLVGIILHILLDLPDVPLFYPFLAYDYTVEEDIIFEWLTDLFTNPIILITETIGILILIFVIVRNKLFNITKIWEYLIKSQ